MTDKLVQGFQRFREEAYEGENPLMPRLVYEGQKPENFIISCSDSRSPPNTIFNQKIGSIFGHKAIGAIVRPYKEGTALAAALQFSLGHLGSVKDVIVLGHTQCGAIKALATGLEDPDIASFVNVAQESLTIAKNNHGDSGVSEELLRATEEQIALQSAKNLLTYPSVAKAVEEGRIRIHAWMFDMTNGVLRSFNKEAKRFQPIITCHRVPANTNDAARQPEAAGPSAIAGVA